MKLTNVLKVFGAAALVAGLTPYRITRDEETGEKKVRALFWEATSATNDEGEKESSVHLGFFSPVEKDDEEPHFFADELTVEYDMEEDCSEQPEETAGEADEAEATEEAVEEETIEEVTEEAAEEAAEDTEAAPEDSEEETSEEN